MEAWRDDDDAESAQVDAGKTDSQISAATFILHASAAVRRRRTLEGLRALGWHEVSSDHLDVAVCEHGDEELC